MNINEIKALVSLDLEAFEIRGAKGGVGNASTTGPVYVEGPFNPLKSEFAAYGIFTGGSPVVTIVGLPVGTTCDNLAIDDIITYTNYTLTIQSIDSASSVTVDSSSLDGTYPIVLNLKSREYLVEPDISANIITQGDATFIQGSTTVTGSGTTWLSSLKAGDYIQHNRYQKYYEINSVNSDNGLTLSYSGGYEGDSTAGAYTAKKWIIGRTRIEYDRNDFTYDKDSAKWKLDGVIPISQTDLTSSTYGSTIGDGIQIAFTNVLPKDHWSVIPTGAPDLMDSAVAWNKLLAQKTQNDTFQFSLPTVPNPEESLDLYINDDLKVRNRDYAINYHQSPIYLPPPPVADRQVANIMPLANADNVTIPMANTENGQIHFVDSANNPIVGVMPGTETIKVNSVVQTPYEDYALDIYSGTAEMIGGTVNEELVKYVAVNKSDLIDYGVKVYLNGKPQAISYPAQNSDDVMVSQSGGLRIKGKDHPGPDDNYEVHYQVTGSATAELLVIQTDSLGNKYSQTSLYPIMNDSVILTKNGILIDEWINYRVSYITGRIIYLTTVLSTDKIQINYTPLSVQVNNLTYTDSTSYNTVYDSRMIVKDASLYQFMLINSALLAEKLQIQRIYNETKNKEYSLTNLVATGHSVTLELNTTNTTIGLLASDVVVADYKYPSFTYAVNSDSTVSIDGGKLEYQPVVFNKIIAPAGVDYMYFSGADVTSEFSTGSVLRMVAPDGALPYYFSISSSLYDGEGTITNLGSDIPTELVNPFIYVTDNTMTFNLVSYTATDIISGSSDILFPSIRIKNLFRPGILIRISGDIYQVERATYDTDKQGTDVKISGTFLKDYLIPTIYVSDQPVYLEGSTELTPYMNIVDTMSQPGLILSGIDANILTDGTSLQVVVGTTTYPFNYSDSDKTDCAHLATAISSTVTGMSAVTYVSDWDSTKIIPGQSLSVSNGYPASVSIKTALRLDGTDTLDFSVNPAGGITLTNGVEKYQRYNLDYMGRRYLGDSTVIYSANYFTMLDKGSKVQATYRYDNLDQFYIQVMSQRDFLDVVTIPRMKEEAGQLNGNTGQGGSIPDDSAQGNDQGGMAGDEFRRQDMAIECNVFKQIYDWFSNRLEAFGNEMYSATGVKLFNNDGIFSLTEQAGATSSFSRIFPPNYTNMEPDRVNPLTGEYRGYWGYFVTGSKNVICNGIYYGFPSYWQTQLKAGDFIRTADSTKMYEIDSVGSDSALTLVDNFTENIYYGDFIAQSGYPIYNDDGGIGVKMVGTDRLWFPTNITDNGHFGIVNGDTFEVYVNGTTPADLISYTFTTPSDLLSQLLYPLSSLSADSVAKMISNPSKGLVATAEWIYDSATPWGYKTAVVLRSVPSSSTWALQKSVTPQLHSVHFCNSNTGWAVGKGGAIYKTTDGGVTWASQLSGTSADLYSVHAGDADNVWAVGATGIPGSNGVIVSTTNGGITWTPVVWSLSNLYSIYMVNNNSDPLTPEWYGWVVGSGGVILTTVNGSVWTSQTSGILTDLNSVHFVNAESNPLSAPIWYGWAVGAGGKIILTTDGGVTVPWTSVASGTTNNLNSVSFVDTKNGWAVGDNGTILNTSTGGITWTPQDPGIVLNFRSVCFVDANTGWAVSDDSRLVKTTNGVTWAIEAISGYRLYSVFFINNRKGWAAGWEFPSGTGAIFGISFPFSSLKIGPFSAISAIEKLGFNYNTEGYCNLDPLKSLPEIALTPTEIRYLNNELPAINYLFTAPPAPLSSGKLNRWHYPTYIDIIYDNVYNELGIVGLEIPKINTQVASTFLIIQEPSRPSYPDTLYAYNNAVAMQSNTALAQYYDSTIVTDWQGYLDGTRWVLDLEFQDRYVRGKNSSGIGIPTSTGTGIVSIAGETTFIIDATVGYDRRILLDATIDSTICHPTVFYESAPLQAVDGVWVGGDPSVDGTYTMDNTVVFQFNSSSPCFVISPDGVPALPTYTTTINSLKLDWTRAEIVEHKNLSFSIYPTVSSLMTEIDRYDGFGVISSYGTNYDYTNLNVVGPISISGYPGVGVFAGSQSPAFSIYYTPTYETNANSLILNDGTLNYASYPTLGDLVTAITVDYTGFTVENVFASEYAYSQLKSASGDMSSASPGTSLYFNQNVDGFGIRWNLSNPEYSIDSTAINLYWLDGTRNLSQTFLWTASTTIGTLSNNLNTKAGFVTSPLTIGLYEALEVKARTSVPGLTTPIIINLSSNAAALRIYADPLETNPTYSVNNSELVLSSDLGSHNISFSTYSKISTLIGYINSLGTWHAVDTFGDMGIPEYTANSFVNASGDASSSAPGTGIFFSGNKNMLSLSFKASDPTYTVTDSELTLSYINGTAPYIHTISFASQPTLLGMVGEINNEDGFDATTIYNTSTLYEYKNLAVVTDVPISDVSLTPVQLGNNSEALRVIYAENPSYTADAAKMAISWPDGVSVSTHNFLYSSYPTLGSLETAIGSLKRFSVLGYFDSGYSYSHLELKSGLINIASPGTYIGFDTVGAPVQLFSIFWEMNNRRYAVDKTAINIIWDENTNAVVRTFPYADPLYNTIGEDKTAIDNITGFTVTGDPSWDASNSESFKIASGIVTPSASIYPALRPCYVHWQSVSDKNLTDRSSFDTARIAFMTARNTYLQYTRESGIMNDVVTEGLLRDSDGNPGDVYTWANNRWNRRQGCNAKLVQIENQITANQSALQINKMVGQ